MKRRVVLGCSAAFVGAFDFGFMTVAASALDRDLRFGGAYPWIFAAGSFAYAASVMPGGTLAARVRPSLVLGGGMLIAALGAATIALAPSAAAALAGRAMLGLGGGLSAAPALALVAGIEPPARRLAAFTYLGGAVATGFSTGVGLAAVLAPAIGWRAVLLLVAIALTGVAACARRDSRAQPGGRTVAVARDESRGARWVAAATIATTLGLASMGATPALTGASLAAAALLACGAYRHLRAWLAAPRQTLALCAAGAATTASGVGATVLLARALSAHGATASLALCAFGAALLPSVALAARLAHRAGPRAATAAGLAIQSIGTAGLGITFVLGVDPLLVLTPLLVLGAGHVVANAGAADAVTGVAGVHVAPAGGLLATAQYVGGGTGSVLVLGLAHATSGALGMAAAACIAATAGVWLALMARRP